MRLMSLQQAAKEINAPYWTVGYWTRNGRLPVACRYGNVRMVTPEAVKRASVGYERRKTA